MDGKMEQLINIWEMGDRWIKGRTERWMDKGWMDEQIERWIKRDRGTYYVPSVCNMSK